MKKKKEPGAVVTDRFSMVVKDNAHVYECKVEEISEDDETYYHLDILSPHLRDMHDHIRQEVHHIEMRLDCASGRFLIRTFSRKLPAELMRIEQQLSDELCNRNTISK